MSSGQDKFSISPDVFLSPQSLGKAVHRVKSSLPKSPTKVPVVITKVMEDLSPRKRRAVIEACDISYKRKKFESNERKKRSDALTQEETDKVEAFFMRDDISRMCPGKKDFVSVKTPSGRVQKQKRLLLLNVHEAYEVFKKESDIKIGKSKFASLRPIQVTPLTSRDQDVCICKYHENIDLILASLAKLIPGMPNTSDSLLDSVVCSNEEACMDGACLKCGDRQSVDDLFKGISEDQTVSYYQWNTSDDGRVRKELMTCTIAEAEEDLMNQLKPFGRHVYNIRRQFKELKHLKENLQQGEVIIHEDFSENFQLKHQREVMAAHWSNEMATLFTAVVYYIAGNGELTHQSYVVVSDELGHDKASVYAFNKAILERVKEVTSVKMVHYWSDGAGSQFKNHYNLASLLFHEEDFNCKATWSFFETAHGKGPVDGVGGEVKRSVWRAILQDKEVVTNAEEFCQTAQKLCSKIEVLYVSKPVIQKERDKLQERWDRCKAIPQTHSVHFAARASDSTVTVAKNSQFFQKDISQEHVLIQDVKHTTTHPTSANPPMNNQAVISGDKAAQTPQKTSAKGNNSHVNVTYGLPESLNQPFAASATFSLPTYSLPLVELLVSDASNFKGSSLIDQNDLRHLYGNGKTDEEKFLSNFIIDEYFRLLQKASEADGLKTKVLKWELFERGSLVMLAQLMQRNGEFKDQDVILVPCNPMGTKHWFLLLVQPQQKLLAVLDSLPGYFVKPTTKAAINKMCNVLQQADYESFDKHQWKFVTNSHVSIPVQGNGYDCGVFVCLYARCLVSKGLMIKQYNIPDFRKHMILELHEKKLNPIPADPTKVDEYYAVDYINKYYFGRVLEVKSNAFIKFKFLHGIGPNKFDWPRRDDIDEVHISCIFYGPVHLEGNRPFAITEQEEVEKVFLAAKK